MNPAQFIVHLLYQISVAHMLHLRSTSYSQHMALGEFYACFPGLVDGIVEEYQGVNGLVTDYPSVVSVTNYSDPSLFLKDLYAFVNTNRNVLGTESHIQNSMDTLLTAISQTVYKIDNLK